MVNDVRILSQNQATKPNDAGKFRDVIVTRFMVGNDGPFSVEQDEATFNPDQQIALVNAKAELVARARAGVNG